MATTVGQHSVASFSTPQNGDPLNANVVRGNDNSVRSAYVDHDADPGIHVQSSVLASRPTAVAAGDGAKWIVTDALPNDGAKLYISNGTSWIEVASLARAADGTAAAPAVSFANDTDTGVFRPTTNVVGLATAGTERGRINAAGYAKFSDTGTYPSATSTIHEFNQSAANVCLALRSSNASPALIFDAYFSGASPNNTSINFATFQDTTTTRCIIYSNGNLVNVLGGYGTISDERLKQDIIPASTQWDDLKAIQFRKYRMKADVAADANAPYLMGVIAQELESVSPGLVDEQVNPDGTTTKTVKSSVLLIKAAKALQEAMARIEALEARVAALEAV